MAVLTVSDTNHTKVNAWRFANGGMSQDHVVELALAALLKDPNGLITPASLKDKAAQNATRDATAAPTGT